MMYNFNFKDKVPPKISKWYIIKVILYTAVLIWLIILIMNKIDVISK